MAGKNLLDQSAARTRHPEHKDGDLRGIALSLEPGEQTFVEDAGNSLKKRRNSRLIVLNLAAFQIVGRPQMLKGTSVISRIFERFRQREMDQRCFFQRQAVPARQLFERRQIGIAPMEGLDFRTVEMRLRIGWL